MRFMTPTFARPNAAFHAYERSLLRPRSWPPTRHDMPTLWERAKAMFAAMLAAITSVADLTRRACFRRKERRALATRLVPVEKLVRMLMMTEAATFLLMTPEGRRLREETPKIEPPAPPPPPVGVPRPSHQTRILMPGWQTIAALQPYVDPRIVEREQREHREALERRIAGLEALTQDAPANADAADADQTHWRCRFRVLRWVHDQPDAGPQASLPRPRCIGFADTNFPIVAGMTVVDRAQRASETSDDAAPRNGHDLARRIEALSRILANPAAAIRRLARSLAALPADALPEPGMTPRQTRDWHHGVPENWNACALARPAFRTLARCAHKHDPG